MGAPSLHEIAAMPFPASVKAMREHYVKDWGKPVPDGVERKHTFSVRVQYDVTYSDDATVEVEAFTEEEAEELAADKVWEDVEADGHFGADIEIIGIKATAIASLDQAGGVR